MVDSVSVRLKNASVSKKNVFKHSYTVECGSHLRVGVRAKTPASRGLRVGPSKHVDLVTTERFCELQKISRPSQTLHA